MKHVTVYTGLFVIPIVYHLLSSYFDKYFIFRCVDFIMFLFVCLCMCVDWFIISKIGCYCYRSAFSYFCSFSGVYVFPFGLLLHVVFLKYIFVEDKRDEVVKCVHKQFSFSFN